MNSSHDYKNYIENDLLGFVDGITSKRMFGGWGFYLYGFIFAFIVEDELYFKTSPEIESEFASRGSEPFVYTGHTSKGPVKMPYWKLPIEIQEDRELLEEWIRRSAEISKKK